MLRWAKRHIPEALLIPAALGAGAVTILSDVDEVVPWGRELGIGVSQLAFAYVGAYIFNWLIVERPKANALRGYYGASWLELSTLSKTPDSLVKVICELTVPQVERPLVLSSADLGRILTSIGPRVLIAQQKFERLETQHEEAYETLVPVLNNFDPAVAVAVAHLRASILRQIIHELVENRAYARDSIVRQHLVAQIVGLEDHGRELRRALDASPHYSQGFLDAASLPGSRYWTRRKRRKN